MFFHAAMSLEQVEEWQAGHRLFHSFIRGEVTPAMKAGISNAGEGNRWMILLQKSFESTNPTALKTRQKVKLSPAD